MPNDSTYRPEFDPMKALLPDIAEERSCERLFATVVERLAARPHVALARIWVFGPGDRCGRCPMRPECPDQRRCLHLAASAGKPTADNGADGSRTDGFFARIPAGVHKVG